MMLKKYRVLDYRKMRVMFRRSLINYHFRCGVDCKINNIDCKDICPKCDDWRGIWNVWKRIDNKYAYYPPKDDTKEK